MYDEFVVEFSIEVAKTTFICIFTISFKVILLAYLYFISSRQG